MAIPDQFENVTISCSPNLYFDGRVISYHIDFPDGSRKTVGIIYSGTYHFGTEDAERMEIVDGTCMVKLDDHSEFHGVDPGEHFDIPANSGFDIAVEDGQVAYVCSYFPRSNPLQQARDGGGTDSFCKSRSKIAGNARMFMGSQY